MNQGPELTDGNTLNFTGNFFGIRYVRVLRQTVRGEFNNSVFIE